MSLEKIEEHVKGLEALKNYDAVKQERDEIWIKAGELERVKTELEGEVGSLNDNVKGLETKLSQAEVDTIKLKTETQDLKSRNTKLEKRIEELERMKVTSEGKTIKEAEEACLGAEKEEINRKVEEKFNEKYAKWQKDEKSKEVLDTSVKELKMILQGLSEHPYEVFESGTSNQLVPIDLAPAGLVAEVERTLNVEVQKQLGVEFKKRVEVRSNEIASKKLEEWKNYELKKWHDEKIMPEIKRLDTTFRSSIIAFLRNNEGRITCKKCGQMFPIKFTGQMVSDLITKGKCNLLCINPNCKDPYTFTGRHQIPITLAEIINSNITLKSGNP